MRYDLARLRAFRRQRGGSTKRRYLVAMLGGVAVVATMLGMHVGSQRTGAEPDHCGRSAAMTRREVLLFDFRKPLEASRALPSDVLLAATKPMAADTAVLVYILGNAAHAPRTLIGRLCKPYDNAELVVAAAKDNASATRGCDDLPAQITPRLRARAKGFCRERASIGARLDALAATPPLIAEPAYLAEAIDQTLAELAEAPARAGVHIYSDMLQHAAWFSHLDTPPRDWSFAAFRDARNASRSGFRRAPNSAPPGLRVTVFHVPREDMTDDPRSRAALEQFWRDYLSPAAVAFDEQAPMPAYASAPLMEVPKRIADAGTRL